MSTQAFAHAARGLARVPSSSALSSPVKTIARKFSSATMDEYCFEEASVVLRRSPDSPQKLMRHARDSLELVADNVRKKLFFDEGTADTLAAAGAASFKHKSTSPSWLDAAKSDVVAPFSDVVQQAHSSILNTAIATSQFITKHKVSIEVARGAQPVVNEATQALIGVATEGVNGVATVIGVVATATLTTALCDGKDNKPDIQGLAGPVVLAAFVADTIDKENVPQQETEPHTPHNTFENNVLKVLDSPLNAGHVLFVDDNNHHHEAECQAMGYHRFSDSEFVALGA
jgi:hypothetical protein